MRFRRLPVRSYILRPRLEAQDGSVSVELAERAVYGRGEGSSARQESQLHIAIDSASARALGSNQAVLVVVVVDLDGTRVERSDDLAPYDVHVDPRR